MLIKFRSAELPSGRGIAMIGEIDGMSVFLKREDGHFQIQSRLAGVEVTEATPRAVVQAFGRLILAAEQHPYALALGRIS